jgi:hypothetical protein
MDDKEMDRVVALQFHPVSVTDDALQIISGNTHF